MLGNAPLKAVERARNRQQGLSPAMGAWSNGRTCATKALSAGSNPAAPNVKNKRGDLVDELKKAGRTERIVQEVEFPDSIEIDFGGPGKRGKLYFNASNLEQAKQRLKNMFELFKLKEDLLYGGDSDAKN